ncbi:MAG: biopolymer transporter ExbD [Bacteroidetes bacterium]|jgi:biopolymer transport protein ExbD|nr:biopolymer transporter ExbD [Bacteroidota bacterium]MCL5268926.1 biopolymer transporter ExbD [Bacteroidota bacterium]
MADVQVAEKHGKQKGKHKKKRRLGVRIDMTPMVDVAFLLLTFFMLTTAFSRPQAMEINLPPSDSKVEVAETNLMTLRVTPDGSIYWNIGTKPPQKVDWSNFRELIVNSNKANSRLITLIKVSRKAKYQDMINIIDELNVDNVTRFSLAPMTPEDDQALAKVGAK